MQGPFVKSHYVRFFIATVFLHFSGLKFRKWRKEIEEIWSITPSEYKKYLNHMIKVNKLMDGAGNVVQSLDELPEAIPTSKKILNSRLDQARSSGKMFSRFTSGTTGTRTKVFLTKNEIGRLLAVRDYCLCHHGVNLGDREARFWGGRAKTLSTVIKDFVLNRKSFFVSNNNLMRTLIELSNWKPDYVYGYSSYLILLSKFMVDNDIKIQGVKLVVCTAEQILPEQKKIIAQAFGSKVVEEYGSTEFDIIGFEDANGDLRIANPWLLVESCENSIMITDVYRRSQSFVKYEIGDAANVNFKLSKGFGGEYIISNLEGRNINQYAYDLNGNGFRASEFSLALNKYFDKYSDIFDFVIVQRKTGHFEFYCSAEPRVGFGEFCVWLKQYINTKTKMQVVVLPAKIGPLDEFAGKRSYFIRCT
ncbi:phenylacetate-CoA ligase [Marinobacter pelagius]|uniref:Phenylacetate-CoA ligase n=1 Tax=Marinobacter pelagius TaxID=379482 RepID=A0A366GFG8_9GAMM|nr:CoF synthetase [Marinobacter pelagius]RBP25688.1 phenylacetate-CoA ligase [Marinobacter pelagius]